MIDLTHCQETINTFGGSEKKKRILYDHRIYMVKFPDPVRELHNSLSYMNNQFSEDIGCKIFKTLGFETQNTFLATYKMPNGEKKIVVACEDFTQDGKKLIEFHKLVLQEVESDSLRTQSNVDNVMMVIEQTKQIVDKEEFKRKFWDMFIVDGYINNRDRNMDNWGGVLNDENELSFAPIYDCGSSLSALLPEELMQQRLNGGQEFKREEFNVYSCYREDRRRILFSEYLKNPHKDLQEAILRIVPKIEKQQGNISKIIETTPVISEVYKTYLKRSLELRYQKILLPALKRVLEKEPGKTTGVLVWKKERVMGVKHESEKGAER